MPQSLVETLRPFRRYGMFLLLIRFMSTNLGGWLFGHLWGGNVMHALQVPFEQLSRGMSGFLLFWNYLSAPAPTYGADVALR